ncbi:MAG: hypothetical protein ACJ8IR_05325 [Alphaproteobacteria bacterium]
MNRRRSVPLALLTALLSAGTAQAALIISHDATKNVTCSGGVCMPTAQNAVLNTGDLTSMLSAGDLTVQTGNGDGTAAGISIVDGFSWTNTNRLTLDAKKNIMVKAPVTVAGKGALTMNYNHGNVDGDLLFGAKGKIDFWDLKSSLVISGGRYTLVGDIKTLAADVSDNPSGMFALANDYDAAADGHYIDSPVKTPFAGTFEGLAHAVKNLSVSVGPYKTRKRPIGLFAQLEQTGSIRDLQVIDASVAGFGTTQYVGAIVGRNYGFIEQVNSSGNMHVQKESYGGGIAGRNEAGATLALATSSAVVHGGRASTIGGLVGENDGLVHDSVAFGRLTGNYDPLAGGLVGYNTGQILTSSSHLKIDLTNTVACGGLVGRNAGDIEQSFWTGTVRCQGWPDTSPEGGLVGDQAGGTVANDYAVGDVTGMASYDVAGGLLGAVSASETSASYSVGAVAAPKAVGAFAGTVHDGAFRRDYWDTDEAGNLSACGTGACTGIKGLSDAKLKSELPAGFDPNVWGQNPKINNGYPYLIANPPQN